MVHAGKVYAQKRCAVIVDVFACRIDLKLLQQILACRMEIIDCLCHALGLFFKLALATAHAPYSAAFKNWPLCKKFVAYFKSPQREHAEPLAEVKTGFNFEIDSYLAGAVAPILVSAVLPVRDQT